MNVSVSVSFGDWKIKLQYLDACICTVGRLYMYETWSDLRWEFTRFATHFVQSVPTWHHLLSLDWVLSKITSPARSATLSNMAKFLDWLHVPVVHPEGTWTNPYSVIFTTKSCCFGLWLNHKNWSQREAPSSDPPAWNSCSPKAPMAAQLACFVQWHSPNKSWKRGLSS